MDQLAAVDLESSPARREPDVSKTVRGSALRSKLGRKLRASQSIQCALLFLFPHYNTPTHTEAILHADTVLPRSPQQNMAGAIQAALEKAIRAILQARFWGRALRSSTHITHMRALIRIWEGGWGGGGGGRFRVSGILGPLMHPFLSFWEPLETGKIWSCEAGQFSRWFHFWNLIRVFTVSR